LLIFVLIKCLRKMIKGRYKRDMKSAVIYCRVSSTRQIDGTSLETQKELCEKYASQHGLTVSRVFIERGESAKTADRPELKNIYEYIKKAPDVSHLLVYKIDRLSRAVEDQFGILKNLRDNGVTLLSVTENIDDTPAGRLMRNLLWSFAQFDNEQRGERIMLSTMARFKEGYWIYGAPRGYKMVRNPDTKRGECIPDKNAPLIKWAFERRVEGWTFQKIADGMNARGYISPKGKQIRPGELEQVLKNPFYHGLMKARGITVRGRHRPLIDSRKWKAAQIVNDENSRNAKERNYSNPKYPLKGLVHCAACGRKLTASASRNKSGTYYPYYHHGAKKCPLANNKPAGKLEEQFCDMLHNLRLREKHRELAKLFVLKVWQQKIESVIEDRRIIDKRRQDLLAEKKNLLALRRRAPDMYTDAEFIEQKEELNTALEEIELEHRKKYQKEKGFDRAVDLVFRYLARPNEAWLDLEIDAKRQFQRVLFPKGLTVDQEGFGTPEICNLLRFFQGIREKGIVDNQLVHQVGNVWNTIIEDIRALAQILDKPRPQSIVALGILEPTHEPARLAPALA
jgi:site-specific DNA recombinase